MLMFKSQKGFSHILIVVVILVVAAVGLVGWRVFYEDSNSQTNKSVANQTGLSQSEKQKDPNEPPLKLKGIGLNLDNYDPATNMAGDLMFTKTKLQFDLLFTDYGYVITAGNSATGQDKANPQPTFIAPEGTKVHALVDGVVIDVPKLYSNDYSVMVGTGDSDSPWRYETEHVINVSVKVGDKVKAGQVVAEVAPHNIAPAGFGIVEIGILHGGNPPQHVCPFAYLDDSIKADVQKKLTAFYKSWEQYKGNTNLYDEANMKIPGCLTLDPING